MHNSIEQIEKRITELQQSKVSLQEQLKQSQITFERNLDDSALRIIDILDMIDTTKNSNDLDHDTNSNAPLIIKKIEKKLIEVLRRWQVQELVTIDGRVEAGKTRVIATRPISDVVSAGAIVEICRKGYQRGDKTLRPTDVITGV